MYPLPSPSLGCAEAIREYADCGSSAEPSVSEYLVHVATVRAFLKSYSRVSQETTPEHAALPEFLKRVGMTDEQAESVFYSPVGMVPRASDLTKLGASAA